MKSGQQEPYNILRILWSFPSTAMSAFLRLLDAPTYFSVLVTNKCRELIHIIYIAALIWWSTWEDSCQNRPQYCPFTFRKKRIFMAFCFWNEVKKRLMNWFIHEDTSMWCFFALYLCRGQEARCPPIRIPVHPLQIGNCLVTQCIQNLPLSWGQTI